MARASIWLVTVVPTQATNRASSTEPRMMRTISSPRPESQSRSAVNAAIAAQPDRRRARSPTVTRGQRGSTNSDWARADGQRGGEEAAVGGQVQGTRELGSRGRG